MPDQLEELVEFLHHGNTNIRQVATEHLVSYSSHAANQVGLFKRNGLEPLRDLKLLIRDYAQIAHDALTILVNLTSCGDKEVLHYFSRDERFVEELLKKIVDDIADPNADGCCGVLANLAKDDDLAKRLIKAERAVPPTKSVKVKLRRTAKGEVEAEKVEQPVPVQVSSSKRVFDQLMDVFVKGANKTLNPAADYDFLSYVFSDLSVHPEGRSYLLERQEYDEVVPITKLVVFTEHASLTRRQGVASTIKNCAFEVAKHEWLMRPENEGGVGLLPYILLPLAGNEEFDADDMEGMLEELQLLPPDKEREVDDDVVATHLETLMLLTAERRGRDHLRRVKVYRVIRELHLKKDAEAVSEGCVRLVNVIMRDEEGDEGGVQKLQEVPKVDEDHKIEEIF